MSEGSLQELFQKLLKANKQEDLIIKGQKGESFKASLRGLGPQSQLTDMMGKQIIHVSQRVCQYAYQYVSSEML